MDTRVQKIITAFLENGWQMIGSVDMSFDWRFDDIILIESIWNPVGKKLYLTLLTDPMKTKKKKVWAVTVSSILPKDKHSSVLESVILNEV